MLLFDVIGQSLKRTDHFNPATDSVEYLKAKFTFNDSAWSGKTKTALFRLGTAVYKSVLGTDGTCKVPAEVLVGGNSRVSRIHGDTVYISLIGEYSTVRITTNEIAVKLNRSGYGDAETPANPTENEYQQMTAVAADAVAEAEEARAACENARADLVGVKNLFANAIKGNLSGAVVVADDVSPVEHNPIVKVHGKNLISYPHNNTTKTENGLTFTDNGDGSITVKGTATAVTYYDLCKFSSRFFSGGHRYFNAMSNAVTFEGYTVKDCSVQQRESGNTFCHLVITAGQTVDKTFYPQVEIGTAATEYTPYIDPATVTVKRCGKNLLSLPYYDGQTITRNGVTCTVNADGSVSVSGTATSTVFFRLSQMNLGASPILAGNSNGVYALTDCTYDSANHFIYCQVNNGETVNKTFFPQVELGTVKTSFETPKTATTHTPGEDGTVSDMTSLSPNMTILTDTEGVIVECEYIRDTNKVIKKLTNAITALGGTV